MRNVTVDVRTRQVLDGEAQDFRQLAEGTLETTADGFLLRYDERDEDGGRIETTLTLRDDRADLRRRGTVCSTMHFARGSSHAFPYRTLYGTFDLTLRTDYLRCALTGSGGKVMIRYTLSAQGQPMGEYTLKINITEKDD